MIALGLAENSAYASSTTTIPGAAPISARSESRSNEPPVGLFGLVTKSRSGCSCFTAATAGRHINTEIRRARAG